MDVGQVLQLLDTIGLLGGMLVALRYVDGLRIAEKAEKDERVQDIVRDWKNLRGLED